MSESVSGKKYTVSSVHDFRKVPEARRELCLREFLVWLAMCDNVTALFKGLPVAPPKDFVWVDDDLHQMDIRISDGKTTTSLVSGTMAGFDREPGA